MLHIVEDGKHNNDDAIETELRRCRFDGRGQNAADPLRTPASTASTGHLLIGKNSNIGPG